MKKKIMVIIIAIFIILIAPIPNHLKDGGTVEWISLTYKVSKVHRLGESGYQNGWIIEILGIKIYDNVRSDNLSLDKNNKGEDKKENKLTWDEITDDGVNEELLLENVDQEILTEIATELQTLIEEEEEEERRNPEIVITEGWTRVFQTERYQKVVNIGTPAIKPLYLILYKSPNAGMYEYICAKALYDISGYDFEWATSIEFLKKFNEKILAEKSL